MAKKEEVLEEASSPAAGGCVLVVLVVVPVAVVWAVSPEAGVLAVWVVGLGMLWRAACRRPAVTLWQARESVGDAANPAPPPGSTPLSEGEEAGHSNIRVERREGMLIIHDLSEQVRYDVTDGEVNA